MDDIAYIQQKLKAAEHPRLREAFDRLAKELIDHRTEKKIQEAYANEIGSVMEDMAKILGFSDEVSDADVLRSANKMLRETVEVYVDRHGLTWTRPTAWSYFAACRALNHWREQANKVVSLITNTSIVVDNTLYAEIIKILNARVDSRLDNEWDEKVRQAGIAMAEDPGTEEELSDH